MNRYELKSLASHFKKMAGQSAQSADIDKVLYDAKTRPTAEQIGPMLGTAGVPDNVGLNIQLLVDKNLGAKFNVIATPAHPSAQALAGKLNGTYSLPISNALKSKGVSVADVVTVPIATF